MKDMEGILTNLGLETEPHKERGFSGVYRYGRERDDFIVLLTYIVPEHKVVTMHVMFPSDIPPGKVPDIEGIILRVNQRACFNHMFIDRRDTKVFMAKNLMIENTELDKEEYEQALQITLGVGSINHKLIREQLSSDDDPDTVLKRNIPDYERKKDRCKLGHLVGLGGVSIPVAFNPNTKERLL